ncbi:mitochondrial carrier [Saitoella complicata NRRL Y-17804]|nr:mitochondrial carrier [Saitoella complicata NRRL Y-17804]ODQ55178.1 mitochondrial carrier [Saitoella complicata NRRL Y-17804]
MSGFMKGVSASLSREATYSTIRFGAYDFFKGFLHKVSGGRLDERGFGNKVMSGLASGCIGASLANPTDLLKIRLQAPSTPHTHLLPTLSFLLRERGFLGLYRACLPTTIRAALLTSSQLASYDHTKHFLMEWGGMREGFGLHFASSAVAGGVCSFVSAPVDVIKVRIMNAPTTAPTAVSVPVSVSPSPSPSPLGALATNIQTPGNILKQAYATGAPPGVIGTTMKIYHEEGLRAFFRGGFMCWMRLWPHTVISLMVFEQLRRWAGIEPI